MDFVSGFAHRLGKPGHLFFEPSMARGAARLGGLLCPYLDLAVVAVARAAGIRRFYRVVHRCRRMVDIDFAIASPTVAAGSRRVAARNRRWRPRAHCRGSGFRLPQPERLHGSL